MKWIFLIFLLSTNVLAQNLVEMKSINFIQEGEVSKLILDFSNSVYAQKSHIKDDKQIILDVKNAKADKKLLRGIDTSEFSGSAVFVSPYKKPGSSNDLRFAIQLRDNVRSFIEKRGTKVILHIENRFGVFTRSKLKKAQEGEVLSSVKENEKVLIPKSDSINDILENLTQSGIKRYVGRKISLNVNNIPYTEILNMISDTSGFNIIIDDAVNKLPPLTLSLTNLPWDQLLDTVMDLGNLVARKYGNILNITTSEKARAEKSAELEEKGKNKILDPLVTKIFPISYATLEDIQKVLESYSTKERGTITPDKRTQNLIVKDTVEVIERMKKIIETLDTQTPQILIEAKIVEASENYEFRAGLADGLKFSYNPLVDADTLASDSAAFSFNSATNLSDSSLLSATVNVGRLTDLAFSLQLMESESKGKIISSPKVITENNKAATISNNTTRTFAVNSQDENGNTVTSVERIPTTVSLNVTPKVTNEGSILMTVSISKSGYGTAEVAGELPPVNSRSISTNVLVDNGSTVVVGGIYQTEDFKLESGVPFLKDLPLIGWLFKNAYNPQKSRNELIIFLTPRVVNQEEAGLVNRELGDNIGI